MSMPVSFYALTAKQAEKYQLLVEKVAAAPTTMEPSKPVADDDWGDVVPKGPDPEDILEKAAKKDTHVFLDWESFGLSYLLGEREQAGRFEPIFGSKDNPPERCAVLSPDKVRAAQSILSGLTSEVLGQRWNPDEMAKAAVYPESAWSEPDALDALIGAFESLKTFFEKAAKNGWAVVVDGRF